LVKLLIAALFKNASEDNGLNKFQQKQQPSSAGSKYNQADDMAGMQTISNTISNFGSGPRPVIGGLTDEQEKYYFLRAKQSKDAQDIANTEARAAHDASKMRQQALDEMKSRTNTTAPTGRRLFSEPDIITIDERSENDFEHLNRYEKEHPVLDKIPGFTGMATKAFHDYMDSKQPISRATEKRLRDDRQKQTDDEMKDYYKSDLFKRNKRARPGYVFLSGHSSTAQPKVSNDWHPTTESMNKLQHALVGNQAGKMKSKASKASTLLGSRPKLSARPTKPPARSARSVAPAAIKAVVRRDVKSTIKMGGVMGGITKFKHTDFLGLITEGNSLTVPLTTSYLMNAGEVTFPFGRRIARNFQRYRITKCTVRFVPIAYPGVNAVTAGDVNSQGSMTLLWNCCPTDDPPTSLVELMNYPAHWRKTSLCTNPLSLVLPVHESGILQNGSEWFYTRPYSVQIDEDQRLTDYGRLHICRIAGNSGNISGASNLGYIYLDYEFELAQPMLSGSIGTDQGSSGYRFLSLVTGTAYFVSPAALASNPFPLHFPTTSSFIIPEAGRYIVTYFTQAVTSVSASVGLTAGTNCTAVNMFPLTGTTNTSSFVAASTASETLSLCVDVVSNGTQTGGTVTTTGVLTIVGTCSGFLFVTCVPSSFQFGTSNSSKLLENLTSKLRDITQRVKLMQLSSDEKEAENERLCEVVEEQNDFHPVTLTASNPPPTKSIQPTVPATATRKGYF